MKYDTTIDVRVDSNLKDPDGYSKILNDVHQILWSKKLPNGVFFNLESKTDDDGRYILIADINSHHIVLSSDIIVTTYTECWTRHQIGKEIIPYIAGDKKIEFEKFAHTFGAFMIFPKRMKDGRTINQNRGTHPKLYDRFDLTLECLRRYFEGKNNPLFDTFKRYDEYLKLFVSFKEFCTFFLLQDLVTDDFNTIKYFIPFVDFNDDPLPKSIDEYYKFMDNCISFIKKRNNRIEAFLKNTELKM